MIRDPDPPFQTLLQQLVFNVAFLDCKVFWMWCALSWGVSKSLLGLSGLVSLECFFVFPLLSIWMIAWVIPVVEPFCKSEPWQELIPLTSDADDLALFNFALWDFGWLTVGSQDACWSCQAVLQCFHFVLLCFYIFRWAKRIILPFVSILRTLWW